MSQEIDVPRVNAQGLYMANEYRKEWTAGKEYVEVKQMEISQQITIPSCTKLKSQIVAKRGTASVPYVATINYTDGTSVKIFGNWNGVYYFDEEVKMQVVSTEACNTLISAQYNN